MGVMKLDEVKFIKGLNKEAVYLIGIPAETRRNIISDAASIFENAGISVLFVPDNWKIIEPTKISKEELKELLK